MESCYASIHDSLLKKSKEFPCLKKEIEINGIIRIKKQDLDFFSFMTKTIISQQISNMVATSIWSRLCDILKSKNFTIHNFRNLAYLKQILKKLKISKQKRNYIFSLYSAISKNEIDIKELLKMNEDQVINFMLQYKGIGPWTCNMALIFYFKKLNIFPENDLVIEKICKKINLLEKKEIDFRNHFSPFLSIFSLHLWKMSKRVL